ncbi:hypothetical protein FRB98_000055 [Tulasnella sp. 332]|nr:hypothetical protein FRB98_000055 [Tulasnella sp. 332]
MDDFSFGNVWGDDSSPKPLPVDLLPSSSRLGREVHTELADDFDAFNDALPHASSSVVPVTTTFGEEDDFGDFGDFGDAPLQTDGVGGFEDDGFDTSSNAFASTSFASPIAPKDWRPLRLDPLPSLQDLTDGVNELLEPLWDERLSDAVWSGESIRQVEGIGQILVTSESRAMYKTFFETPLSPSRPPNWTRSRIRRQHLIALGIPINLDEMLPHANGKPLPALNIITRPSSTPPTPRPTPLSVSSITASVTRPSTPKASRPNALARGDSGLGPAPQLDQAKVAQMLALDSETLSLLPLSTLNAHLDTLRSLTATSSSLLSHLLQSRAALQEESEHHNSLIAELIAKETLKMQAVKSGARRQNSQRRSGRYSISRDHDCCLASWGMKAAAPVILEENALVNELASIRAALSHYQVITTLHSILMLNFILDLLPAYQHASDAGALQLQRRSFDANAALERQKQLEIENERLTQELSILSRNPNKQPHPATLSVTELTLAHRRLSDRLSTTETLLLDRTAELNHALRKADISAAVASRSQSLLERARLERENDAKRARSLQSRTKAAVEEKLMLERIVEDYAALVRGIEARSPQASDGGSSASPSSPGTPSGRSAISAQAETGRMGLQRLLEEMNATVEPLQQHNFQLQTEIDDLRVQLEAARRGGEEDRTKLALARVSLEQYLCDDNSAAKLVSRYMKFSQTSIDLLQTALDSQRTRSEARIVTLEGQLQALQKSLIDSRQQTTRLRDALDELTENISRETYGRRREIALRLKLISREEQVSVALRTLVHGLDEGRSKLSASYPDGDGAKFSAPEELLSTISDEAVRLLQALDGQGASDLKDEASVPGGPLARIIASEDSVTTLVMELERETERRLTLERRLGEYISSGPLGLAEDIGYSTPTPSDLGVGWSKETLVTQQLVVHPISPFQRLSFGQPLSSPVQTISVRNTSTDNAAKQPTPAPPETPSTPDTLISYTSDNATPPSQAQGMEVAFVDSSVTDTAERVISEVELPESSDHSAPSETPSPLYSPISPRSTSSAPSTTSSKAPDDDLNAIMGDLSQASGQYNGIANSLRSCAATLAKLKAQDSLPVLPTSPTSPETVLAKAYLDRLNDALEDCQVEVEILMADEDRLIHGFRTMLSIPAALADTSNRQRFITEVERFVQSAESDVTGQKAVFQRKVDDIEHDIALLKSSLYQIEDIGSKTPKGGQGSSPMASIVSWPWPSDLLSPPANRSRPGSPTPTFVSTMTQQSKSPSYSQASGSSSPVIHQRSSVSLCDLPFRIPMPKPPRPAPSPLTMNASLSIPGRLNPFLMKPRAVSSGMLTPPNGLKSTRFASTSSSTPTAHPMPTSSQIEASRALTQSEKTKSQTAETGEDDVEGGGTETDSEGAESVTDIE